MTYHMQFSKSPSYAPGLCGEFCSWMQEPMHHDGHDSSMFALPIDHSFYDTYDIADLNFVIKLRLQFRICSLTYELQAR